MRRFREAIAGLAEMKPACRATVVRSGALGDTVLLLPTLRLLREALPEAHVTLVGSWWAEQLLGLMPDAPHFVRFDSAALTPLFSEQAGSDRCGVFARADLVLLYTSKACGALVRNARRFCRGVVLGWPAMPAEGIHAACHLACAVLSEPVVTDQLPLPVLRVPSEAAGWAEAWLGRQCGPDAHSLVAVHPGSGGRGKCWPAGRFIRLLRRLCNEGLRILLIEGPADRWICDEICRGFPGPGILRPGVQGLLRCAALLGLSRFYIGNDSGITHVAAALGVPSVVLFGPTDPAVWAPLGRKVCVCGGEAGRWPAVEEVLARVNDLVEGWGQRRASGPVLESRT